MIRYITYFFFCVLNIHVHCQEIDCFEKRENQSIQSLHYFSEPLNKDNKIIRISIGAGIQMTKTSKDYNNLLYSFEVMPQLTEYLYAGGRIDLYKLLGYNITAVVITAFPSLGLNIIENKFKLFFEGGISLYGYGNRGIDASFTPSLKIEYGLNTLISISAVFRKPVFFYRDTGHNQYFTNIYLTLKF